MPALLDQSVCTMWATISDVCSPCNVYTLDPALLEERLLWASEILFNLTYSQWPGACTDVIRPIGAMVGRGIAPSWSGQQISATGAAATRVCGCSGEQFGCQTLSVVRLPLFPVISVTSVKVNGAVLDPTFYRVDDHRKLTFLPGDTAPIDGWPCCQRVDLAATEDDTFEVAYTYGKHPPMGGVVSAATLGCQLTLAVTNSGACALPKRIQTLTRQNVTATFMDTTADVRDGGWTGLPDVDGWVASIRFARANRAGAVYDPQRPRAHRRVNQ
jgi:hypothetical protein